MGIKLEAFLELCREVNQELIADETEDLFDSDEPDTEIMDEFTSIFEDR